MNLMCTNVSENRWYSVFRQSSMTLVRGHLRTCENAFQNNLLQVFIDLDRMKYVFYHFMRLTHGTFLNIFFFLFFSIQSKLARRYDIDASGGETNRIIEAWGKTSNRSKQIVSRYESDACSCHCSSKQICARRSSDLSHLSQ